MQNLSNIILEDTSYGKILFNQAINLTNDTNPNDNIIDLDIYMNISSNRIEIDSTALQNFNKSATLWLYDLTFSNPRILRDDGVCPSSICTEESYSSGILKFNVTSFSAYSSEETPITPSLSPGGGGEGRECTYNWDCTNWNDCLPGGKQKRSCVNIGSCSNTYMIPETEKDCSYKESKEVLFDLVVSTLPKSEEIFPDTKKISFIVSLVKFGLPEELTELKVNYKIYNQEETLYEETQNLKVQKKISFIKTVGLPELSAGIYQIDVKIDYDNKTAEGKTSFIVREKTEKGKARIYLFFGVLAVILIIGIILFIKFKEKKSLNLKPVSRLRLKRSRKNG